MNRKDVNFHLFMIILSAMIECECPHMYGRKGGEMCPLAEQTTEVGAPGHLNFSCKPEDRRGFMAWQLDGLVVEGSCCPAANPDHFISLRLKYR